MFVCSRSGIALRYMLNIARSCEEAVKAVCGFDEKRGQERFLASEDCGACTRYVQPIFSWLSQAS